jgi:phage terminase large subunit
MFLVRELYGTGRLVEDWAASILAIVGDRRPSALVCDHDAEDRATLGKHLGFPTVPAQKSISDGIQAVKARLRAAGDGRPRLFIFQDATRGRDEAMDEARRPVSTQEEMDCYVWDARVSTSSPVPRDLPMDADNHGLDCLRYAVAEVDGLARRQVEFY